MLSLMTEGETEIREPRFISLQYTVLGTHGDPVRMIQYIGTGSFESLGSLYMYITKNAVSFPGLICVLGILRDIIIVEHL